MTIHNKGNQKMLKVEIGAALSFKELQFMVGKEESRNCRWVDYNELSMFKSIDDLLDKGAAVILLHIEKPRATSIGHFVLILDHPDEVEHFDSYGLTLDQETKITGEANLTKLFQTSTKKYIDNSIRMQRFAEDINTCGRWVVARFLLRKMRLKAFHQLIDQLGRPDDETVTAMTLLLEFKR